MLVGSPHVAPPAALDQSVGAVDVEPLLIVPLGRTGRTIKCLERREPILRRQDVWSICDKPRTIIAVYLQLLRWELQGGLLVTRERIPCLNGCVVQSHA